MRIFTLLALLSIVMFGCSGSGGSGERVNTTVKEIKEAPAFNADSAYYYVEKQVSFGPRVPNSEAHKKASAWFKSKFEAFGAKVTMQEFEDYVYSGTKVELVNVIASYNLDKPKRIYWLPTGTPGLLPTITMEISMLLSMAPTMEVVVWGYSWK